MSLNLLSPLLWVSKCLIAHLGAFFFTFPSQNPPNLLHFSFIFPPPDTLITFLIPSLTPIPYLTPQEILEGSLVSEWLVLGW